jgi:uncharacterized membrane protein
MENAIRIALGYVIPVVETCGALVILIEVFRTFTQYILVCVRRECVEMRPMRVRLGQAMVMGLEFQVAADILKTALAPTWNDILLLAALIGLRTVLNFLLERELEALNADNVIQSCEADRSRPNARPV